MKVTRLLPLLAFAISTSASATILTGAVTGGTSQTQGGSFMKLTPPVSNPFGPANSIGEDTFQDPNLYGIDEGQNLTIPLALSVDDLADGSGGGAGAGTLAAGTVVASHYVFFDPDNSTTQTGFVQFDSDILGVISSTANLAASDFFIPTGINYLNPTLRGLEGGDSVTITGLQEISVNWRASSPGDYVRVLTEFSPGATPTIPEPSILALFGIGLAGLGLQRRRHRS